MHCIKCGVVALTTAKQEALDHEYHGFQWWMQFGIDKDILSQHKRAKGWYYEKEKIRYKTYPLVIPHIRVWYRHKDTKLTPHWMKISVRKRKGVGVWLPIKPHKPLPNIQYLRDSLLLKNNKGDYELRLHYDIPPPTRKVKHIVAIDLGEKVIATVCDSLGNQSFLGREIRATRRHYAWLRKRLGRKKLLKKIKKIGQKEKNIVRNRLHHISNAIVEQADKHNAMIVLGKLKGIRKKTRNKKGNRCIFSMPYYTLQRMISYKAAQRGLPVQMITEHYSSVSCHRCGNIDKTQRKTQGLFHCNHCHLQYNADLNGARNILQRATEQGFVAGALAEAQKLVALVN